MTPQEAVDEIRECVKYENLGRVLGRDDTTVRIRFNNTEDAASWISNYARLDGATFETTPATMAEPVIVRLGIWAYSEER